MPGTEALKIPHQTGEIPPPGKPDGTGKARPVRKISSLPEIGTVVVQVLELLSNVVVAQVALGLKTILPLGTAALNALDVTVEPQKLMVAPLLGIPLALIWALNQMVSPAPIAVPLKFDWMHDSAHGGQGVGVGVGVGDEQFIVSDVWPLGKVIDMVFNILPFCTKLAVPEYVCASQNMFG
jgi:hypothetical protein